MTYEQFWYDCPSLYYVYQDAYQEKIKLQDLNNWQLGIYIQNAIVSSLEPKVKYPCEPLFYKEKQKQLTMLEKFEIMMKQVNKKFE